MKKFFAGGPQTDRTRPENRLRQAFSSLDSPISREEKTNSKEERAENK